MIDYKKAFDSVPSFMDTQMPPDVQDLSSTNNIHRVKYESLEDHHDTSLQ